MLYNGLTRRDGIRTVMGGMVLALLMVVSGVAWGFEQSVTPLFNGGDGTYTTTTKGGQTVWVPDAYLYFQVSSSFPASVQSAYVKIEYYDDIVGSRVWLQFDSDSEAYTQTGYHTNSSGVGSNAFKVSYQRLDNPNFANRQNGGADFRFTTGGLGIRSVVVRDTPFDDAYAQYALSHNPPWLGQYTGPTFDDVRADTLKGKVVCGYQGWFRTPNDLYDSGFDHWTVDMWPDPADYESASLVAMPGVTTVSNKQGYVFSSADFEVVHKHFKWMRKYNIDGVYLQRFFVASTAGANPEWVLAHVREAANLEGRVWAIEYDISGATDSTLYNKITDDWKWLVDECEITEDSRYLHENGKPVVVIWGAGIREPSAGPLNSLVDFFKNDPVYGGNYVVGCVASWFPSEWDSHYGNYDSIFAWMGSLQNVADRAALYGIPAQAHVWPGFSWHNLYQLTFPTQYTDRNGGQTYWTRMTDAMSIVDPEAIFIGMFDEYDESTAIMPMSDDPPTLPNPNVGHYITNDGKPSDYWMSLTGYAKEMLWDQVAFTTTVPAVSTFDNRSNVGAEVSVTLGSTNTNNLLEQFENTGDGNTSAWTVAGVPCRRMLDYYMYFRIDDSVLYQVSSGADVTIIVDYYDTGGGVDLGLQYDSAGMTWRVHPKSIVVSGSDTWRSVRFEISDGYFGNRENGGDFRLCSFSAHHNMNIARVRVVLPDDVSLSWEGDDVGSVGYAGNATMNNGVFTVEGGGADIWNTADEFHFVSLDGLVDCSLTARVASIENTNAWAKAGVMIRESDAAGSKHAMMAVTAANGLAFQRRTSTNGASYHTGTSGSAPRWVRITRVGDVFTGYVSTDGSSWTQVGSVTIAMERDVQIGLCVTSHDDSTLCTAVFDHVSVTQ